MEKIKIGEEEFTVEEIQAGMMKNADYTQKTQALADEKRILQADQDNVKDLRQLQQYANENPELNDELRKIMAKEQAKVAGVPYKDDEEEAEEEEELSGLTEKEVEDKVSAALRAYEQKQSNKEMQKNFNKEVEELKKKGYTQEELVLIAEYGRRKNMISPKDAANSLIVQEKVPNKYKTKEKETPPPILGGRAASGFDIEDPEKELLKFDGDPAAMLKARPEKLFTKED